MKLFLKERVEFHVKKAELVPFDITLVKNYLLKYRSVPKNNLQDCSEMLRKYGFLILIKIRMGKVLNIFMKQKKYQDKM